MRTGPGTAGVRTVAVFEAAKGLLVLVAGFSLLSLVHHDVQHTAETIVRHLHLNPARHYPRVFIEAAGRVSNSRLWLLAGGAFAYSLAPSRHWPAAPLSVGGVVRHSRRSIACRGPGAFRATRARPCHPARNLLVVAYLLYCAVAVAHRPPSRPSALERSPVPAHAGAVARSDGGGALPTIPRTSAPGAPARAAAGPRVRVPVLPCHGIRAQALTVVAREPVVSHERNAPSRDERDRIVGRRRRAGGEAEKARSAARTAGKGVVVSGASYGRPSTGLPSRSRTSGRRGRWPAARRRHWAHEQRRPKRN